MDERAARISIMRPKHTYVRVPLIERFWRYVDKSAAAPCWRWTGCLAGGGYGQIRDLALKRAVYAHRVSYEHARGPVPADMTLDHLCRNRWCVNPEHLEIVTRGENVMRGVGFAPVNARKTHCPRGHEYTAENTRHNSATGHRFCRQCHQMRKRAARHTTTLSIV